MELTVVHNPTQYDIPIATIAMPDITSDMMVQVSDFSLSIRSNIDPLRKPQFYSSTALHAQQVTLAHTNVMMTNAFAYDAVLKRSTPLWYHHSLSGVIHTDEYMERTIAALQMNGTPVIIQIPESITARTSIVEGSVIVTHPATAVRLGDEYMTGNVSQPMVVVDYARGTITLAPGTADAAVHISYRMVTIAVAVKLPTGYVYRLAMTACTQQPSYFTAAILTDYPFPIMVTYDRCGTDNAIQHSEYTQVSERWRQSDVVNPGTDRVYTISTVNTNANTVTITGGFQPYSTYAFMTRWTDSAMHRIRIAPDCTFDECWPLQIKCKSQRLSVKRKGYIIDQTHIKVPNDNLYVTRSSSGRISNITVLRDNDEAVTVADGDAARGIVETAEPVSKKETVYVAYDYVSEYVNLPYICMNPTHVHEYPGLCDTAGTPWSTIRSVLATKACIMTLIETATGIMQYGVTITSRVRGGVVMSYDADKLDSLFTPTTGITPLTIYLYDAATASFSPYTKAVSDHIYPLAALYLSSPFDESAITIEDARVYGGGTNTKLPNQYDTTYYDGEITDMSSRLRITVAKTVYDELTARIRQHDPKVVTADNPDEEAAIIAKAKITKAAEKAVLSGSLKEIVIE